MDTRGWGGGANWPRKLAGVQSDEARVALDLVCPHLVARYAAPEEPSGSADAVPSTRRAAEASCCAAHGRRTATKTDQLTHQQVDERAGAAGPACEVWQGLRFYPSRHLLEQAGTSGR